MHVSKQKGDYKTALRKYRKALRYLDVCWEKEELDESMLLRLSRDGISYVSYWEFVFLGR